MEACERILFLFLHNRGPVIMAPKKAGQNMYPVLKFGRLCEKEPIIIKLTVPIEAIVKLHAELMAMIFRIGTLQ